jgi:16S rRNA C967 or C1407 C5-methylase (RsmB/RsmF family)
METFLATNKEAQINALDTNEDFSLVSRKLKYGYQILPNDNGPDGFYFASLSKRK